LQKVNEAYAEQDLFYLLKLQLQLETNKGLSSKALSSEQVKFYQLSLEAQSQNLQSQLEEIFASFHLSSHINTKQLKMSDVYKVIDKDAAELKAGEMGKGTFKAYEKGEWGGDVVGAWGFMR
jgi:hypothetical protein